MTPEGDQTTPPAMCQLADDVTEQQSAAHQQHTEAEAVTMPPSDSEMTTADNAKPMGAPAQMRAPSSVPPSAASSSPPSPMPHQQAPFSVTIGPMPHAQSHMINAVHGGHATTMPQQTLHHQQQQAAFEASVVAHGQHATAHGQFEAVTKCTAQPPFTHPAPLHPTSSFDTTKQSAFESTKMTSAAAAATAHGPQSQSQREIELRHQLSLLLQQQRLQAQLQQQQQHQLDQLALLRSQYGSPMPMPSLPPMHPLHMAGQQQQQMPMGLSPPSPGSYLPPPRHTLQQCHLQIQSPPTASLPVQIPGYNQQQPYVQGMTPPYSPYTRSPVPIMHDPRMQLQHQLSAMQQQQQQQQHQQQQQQQQQQHQQQQQAHLQLQQQAQAQHHLAVRPLYPQMAQAQHQ